MNEGFNQEPKTRAPGELSLVDRVNLRDTLAEKGVEVVDDYLEPVTVHPAQDSAQRRADQMDEQEIEGIIERRTPPLTDAPAVREAFRKVVEIARELKTPKDK